MHGQGDDPVAEEDDLCAVVGAVGRAEENDGDAQEL